MEKSIVELSLNDDEESIKSEESLFSETEKREIEESKKKREEKEKKEQEFQKLLEKEVNKAKKMNTDQLSNEDDSDSDEELLISPEKEKSNAEISNLPQSFQLTPVHHVFDLLPDETLLKIWSFLDPPSIGRLSQVCKRFKATTYDTHLWREAAENWKNKNGNGESGTILGNVNRSFYVKQFRSYRRRERLEEENRIQYEEERRKEVHRHRAAKVMKATCYARFWEWISVLSLVLLTIFSVLKLEGVTNARWPIIFIPMFFLLAQLIIAPLMFDSLRGYFDYSFDKELEPDEVSNRFCGPIFFFLAFSVPLQESLKTARMIIYPSVFTFTLWIVLLVIKIDNPSIGMPYWAVFLPFLVFLFIFSQIPLWIGSRNVFTDYQRLDRIIVFFLVSLFMVFVILLVMKLDGKGHWSWYHVMLPLWILKGLLVFIPILFSLITLCLSVTNSQSMYTWRDRTRWADKAGTLCLTFIGLSVLVFAPLLTFEVLLAQALQGDSASFSLIFIPVFVLEGFGICGCCVVNCAFVCSEADI